MTQGNIGTLLNEHCNQLLNPFVPLRELLVLDDEFANIVNANLLNLVN